MATFLRMSWFVTLTAYHICYPSCVSLLLLGWWFQQFSVFISISHIFFISNYSFLMFQLPCVQTRCPSPSLLWLSGDNGCKLVRKKVVNKLLYISTNLVHAEVRACASLFNLELLRIACSTFLKPNLGYLLLLGSRDAVCFWSSWAEVAAFR